MPAATHNPCASLTMIPIQTYRWSDDVDAIHVVVPLPLPAPTSLPSSKASPFSSSKDSHRSITANLTISNNGRDALLHVNDEDGVVYALQLTPLNDQVDARPDRTFAAIQERSILVRLAKRVHEDGQPRAWDVLLQDPRFSSQSADEHARAVSLLASNPPRPPSSDANKSALSRAQSLAVEISAIVEAAAECRAYYDTARMPLARSDICIQNCDIQNTSFHNFDFVN